jgi:hypothetical protein
MKAVVLGGLVVIVLVTAPMVRWFKLGRGLWIYKGDKIRSTIYLGGKLKPSAASLQIYGMLKIPAEYDRDTS